MDQINHLIEEVKKERFHDFYASEDSEGDTKDVAELVVILNSFDEPCTNEISNLAKQGKYDAKKGDEDDL